MEQTDRPSLWIPCPICSRKTRTKVYEDSVLVNFLPKVQKRNPYQCCKTENDCKQMSQTVVAEPASHLVVGGRFF